MDMGEFHKKNDQLCKFLFLRISKSNFIFIKMSVIYIIIIHVLVFFFNFAAIILDIHPFFICTFTYRNM